MRRPTVGSRVSLTLLESIVRFADRRLTSQRGQGATEYLVALSAVIGLIFFSLTFRRAIAAYLQPIYFIVALPIP